MFIAPIDLIARIARPLATALCLAAAPLWAQDAAPPPNLLTLAQGATLVEGYPSTRLARSLVDGNMASNWSTSTRRTPPPYSFVVELIGPTFLTAVGATGAGTSPRREEGGSAGPISVEASATGPDTGFMPLASFFAAPEGDTLTTVSDDQPMRWLRFTIEGGQTPEVAWLYLNELVAHGIVDRPDNADRFTGIFQVGEADTLDLRQSGSTITGCFTDDDGTNIGTLYGANEGGVALIVWESEDGNTGSALFTRNSSGVLVGVRYDSSSRTDWGGPPVQVGKNTPCSAAPPQNPVAAALQGSANAQIYGIEFEPGSDVLRQSALPALQQLFEALNQTPDQRFAIKRHSGADSNFEEAEALASRRAAAVVAWLGEQGIEAGRIEERRSGFYQSVAPRSTAAGRALIQRFELSMNLPRPPPPMPRGLRESDRRWAPLPPR